MKPPLAPGKYRVVSVDGGDLTDVQVNDDGYCRWKPGVTSFKVVPVGREEEWTEFQVGDGVTIGPWDVVEENPIEGEADNEKDD